MFFSVCLRGGQVLSAVLVCTERRRWSQAELEGDSECNASLGASSFTQTGVEGGKEPGEENVSAFSKAQPFPTPCLLPASCKSAVFAGTGLSALLMTSVFRW